MPWYETGFLNHGTQYLEVPWYRYSITLLVFSDASALVLPAAGGDASAAANGNTQLRELFCQLLMFMNVTARASEVARASRASAGWTASLRRPQGQRSHKGLTEYLRYSRTSGIEST